MRESCNSMLSLRWSSKVIIIIVPLVIDKKHRMYVLVHVRSIYTSNLFLQIKQCYVVLYNVGKWIIRTLQLSAGTIITACHLTLVTLAVLIQPD